MKDATLVVMAAGIGSRFGGGIKQLGPMGPSGEIIMDYSIYDAKQAGFDTILVNNRHPEYSGEFCDHICKTLTEMLDVLK